MLEIRLSNQASKFLKKLVPKHRKQVAGKIKELTSDPLPHDSKTVKGHAPYMRADIGEYRLIYKTQDDKQLLLVAIIGKRNDDHVSTSYSKGLTLKGKPTQSQRDEFPETKPNVASGR